MLPFRYMPDSWLNPDRIPELCFYQDVRKQLQFKHLALYAPSSRWYSHKIIVPNPEQHDRLGDLLYKIVHGDGERKRQRFGTFNQCIRLQKVACLRITSCGTSNEVCSRRTILLTYQPDAAESQDKQPYRACSIRDNRKLGGKQFSRILRECAPSHCDQEKGNQHLVRRSESLWKRNRRRKQ